MPDPLDINEFRSFRDHFRDICGVCLADDMFPRVKRIIGARMSELNIASFGEYRRKLDSSRAGSGEWAQVTSLLTVGETYFFRNQDHWRALEQCVLPWILEQGAATRKHRLRIWSAACSTGEEAYTAAIVVSRSLPARAGWSVEILGTDLRPAAIASANRAVYSEHSFRGVTPEMRQEYFEPVGSGQYTPRADLRELVHFRELNLLDSTETSRIRDIDVVFCRNVLIYFDAASIAHVMSCLRRSMRSDGYLFLGHAEYAHGAGSDFASLNVGNTFIYKPMPLAKPSGLLEQVPADPAPAFTRAGLEPVLECETSRKQLLHEDRPERTTLVQTTLVQSDAPSKVMPPDPPESPEASERPADSANPDGLREKADLESLRIRSTECLCEQQHADARELFREILRRSPSDLDSQIGMALILAGEGRSDGALEQCARILEVDPLSAEAHCVKALVYEGQGEHDAAQAELEKSIYLDDGFSMAHFRLAALHLRAGRREDAARASQNTLRVLPRDDERRVRLFSGGFSKQGVEQICERQLDTTPPATAGGARPSGSKADWR